MGTPTAIHPQAIVAIDSVNNRVILEYAHDQSVRRVEYFRRPDQPFLEVIDVLLKKVRGQNVRVGVYPGPGKFTKTRTAVLVAHLVAREYCYAQEVSSIPLSSMDKPLLERWARFRTENVPRVIYGKPPSITRTNN